MKINFYRLITTCAKAACMAALLGLVFLACTKSNMKPSSTTYHSSTPASSGNDTSSCRGCWDYWVPVVPSPITSPKQHLGQVSMSVQMFRITRVAWRIVTRWVIGRWNRNASCRSQTGSRSKCYTWCYLFLFKDLIPRRLGKRLNIARLFICATSTEVSIKRLRSHILSKSSLN